MTSRRKKLLVTIGLLFALIGAATAGAVVRYTIFTIQTNNFAHLAGTNVYCKNVLTRPRSFLCVIYGPTRVAPNTYTVGVGVPGVEIVRAGANGKAKSPVRSFLNP